MKNLILLALALTTPLAHAAEPKHSERIGLKRLELAHELYKAYEANEVCDAEAYPSDIVNQISSARYMVKKGSMRKFLKTISPKAKIRGDLAFRNAIEEVNIYRSDYSEAELTKALLGTKFYHFGQGAYGSGYNVTLQANGVAHENILEVLNEAPWSRWTENKTTWSLVPNKDARFLGFNLRVGNLEFRMDVEEQGEIWWIPVDVKEGEKDYQRTLTTSDAYCDA
jgi:hypothetical protein